MCEGGAGEVMRKEAHIALDKAPCTLPWTKGFCHCFLSVIFFGRTDKVL